MPVRWPPCWSRRQRSPPQRRRSVRLGGVREAALRLRRGDGRRRLRLPHAPDCGSQPDLPPVGLATFKPAAAAGRADGLLVVFVVEDVDAEHDRLLAQGVTITTPIETEDWGERYFQVTDPNGVVFQLVTWADDS